MQTPTVWPAGWVPADGQAIGAVVYQQVAHFGVFQPPLGSPDQHIANPVGRPSTARQTATISDAVSAASVRQRYDVGYRQRVLPCQQHASSPSSGAGSQLQDGGGAIKIGAQQGPRTLAADAHRRILEAGRRVRSCRGVTVSSWATLPDVSRTDNRCSSSPGCAHHSSRREAAAEPSTATAARKLRVIPQTVACLHRRCTGSEPYEEGTPTPAS